MKGTSTFQIVLISIFGAFIVIAIAVFALSKTGNKNKILPVTIWGEVSEQDFNNFASNVTTSTGQKLSVTYVQQQPASFDQNLVEAIASGDGPDIVLLPQDLIVRYANKIYPLPYASYPLRTYETNYVQEADLFTTPGGILAFPFDIDPLMMYWNRDLLTSAGVVTPPATWSDVLTLPALLTKKDAVANIAQSAVALGEFSNVTNAESILSAMFLQVGVPIVSTSNQTGTGLSFTSNFSSPEDSPQNSSQNSSPGAAASAVLQFYTQFSDPAKTVYSWNRALTDSQDMFAQGDLAIYFGFASEYNTILAKNPNLNFEMATLPQPTDTQTKATFGNIQGFAVLKSSRNISNAFQNVFALTAPTAVTQWTANSQTSPALLSLIALKHPSNPIQDLVAQSALISKGWLDPEPSAASAIFQNMIESVTSGASNPGNAVSNAQQAIQQVIYSQ
jgi:ABC-type glycerol-3-phosphate transport system substrate-binding protein